MKEGEGEGGRGDGVVVKEAYPKYEVLGWYCVGPQEMQIGNVWDFHHKVWREKKGRKRKERG